MACDMFVGSLLSVLLRRRLLMLVVGALAPRGVLSYVFCISIRAKAEGESNLKPLVLNCGVVALNDGELATVFSYWSE